MISAAATFTRVHAIDQCCHVYTCTRHRLVLPRLHAYTPSISAATFTRVHAIDQCCHVYTCTRHRLVLPRLHVYTPSIHLFSWTSKKIIALFSILILKAIETCATQNYRYLFGYICHLHNYGIHSFHGRAVRG